MTSPRISSEQLLGGFRNVGLERGDVVYVASSLAALGLMPNPVMDTLSALREAVGPEGTLVMPAFNFGFCKGEPFDCERTPSQCGVLSEAFRGLPGVVRSWAPPYHSVCAAGPRAREITELEALTSFGSDSVFQHLVDMGAKHLLIGCGYQEGVAHFHWIEELCGVPYRYFKKFEGTVIRNGTAQRRAFFMYARREVHNVLLNADPLGLQFEQTGLVRHAEVGFCRIRSFRLSDFSAYFKPRFSANPSLLLASAPIPAVPSSPVKRIHHIGVVSRYSDKIRSFLETLSCDLAFEGVVPEIGVNCRYFTGLDIRIELVEPLHDGSQVSRHSRKNPTCPLHHIAFEVDRLEDAVAFFRSHGYEALDGQFHFGPTPYERVVFLSPVETGGLLVELVANDGKSDPVYGGQQTC
ncbi:MAG: AAC(3) family N-acetyltransferase [Acidobacteriota bacterium]